MMDSSVKLLQLYLLNEDGGILLFSVCGREVKLVLM